MFLSNTIHPSDRDPGEVPWPPKRDLFGVGVSQTSYEESEALIMQAALQRSGAIVTHLPVHGLVDALRDPVFRAAVNSFELVAPDGQPVRWALNRFYGAALRDRVYGPELMLRLCRRAAETDLGVFLYGGRPEVVLRLRENLLKRCPGLRIVGCESPPFRALSTAEMDALAGRINASGAGLVFIGLGCPKQDLFAQASRRRIGAVLLCVGAAFDFHAGSKKMAPPWMQRCGLEWFFRLTQEPRRLWRRYLVSNSVFAFLVLRRLLVGR